jgi:hypothetical protein
VFNWQCGKVMITGTTPFFFSSNICSMLRVRGVTIQREISRSLRWTF